MSQSDNASSLNDREIAIEEDRIDSPELQQRRSSRKLGDYKLSNNRSVSQTKSVTSARGKTTSKSKHTTRVIQGHAMAIRDFSRMRKKGQQSLLNNHAIPEKDFGKEDQNGQTSMQWHNREKDWYNAERRFIFAAPTP